MTNDTKMINNVETDEITILELTDAEQLERNAESLANEKSKNEAKLKAENLRSTKIEAYTKLGLTSDEIEALLPTPEIFID
jgi:uncharacterized ferredoxin-like protein